MRFVCPHCGERDAREFKYRGDAGQTSGREDVASVYFRQNSVAVHTELWQHVGGCRCWLEVSRNTTTHEIYSVKEAGA